MVLALAAAAPLLAVLAGLWSRGWSPSGDDGLIALRSFDVLSRHGPLVGQVNLAHGVQPVFDPGPLQNWVLAIPTRLFPDIGPAMGALVFDAACVVAAVLAVARSVGRVAALIVAAGALVGFWSAIPAMVEPVWNGHSGLVPFAALVVCGWAVGSGGLVWWPVVVFLASYCTQTHLVYAPGSVAVVVVSPVLGLWAARTSGRRPGWTWFAVGSGVGVLSWSAPFWQQLTGNPGNLWLLYKTTLGAQQAHLGGRFALEQVGSVIGPIPQWLKAPARLGAMQVAALHGNRPWAVGAVVALVALVGIATWRRDHAVIAAAAVALIADVSAFWVLDSVPAATFFSLSYLRWVLWPAGMMTWLALGWGSFRLLNTALVASGRPRPNEVQRSRVLTVGTAVVVVASVALCLERGKLDRAVGRDRAPQLAGPGADRPPAGEAAR